MSRFASALTPTGYVRVQMTDIVSDLNNIVRGAGGAAVDLDPRSPVGQGVGGVAEMLSDLEGIAADVVTSLVNPNSATGAGLSGLMVLTGCPRNGSTYSTAPATFSGTQNTVIPVNAVVRSTLDGSLWSPSAQVTIGASPTAGTLVCQALGPPAGGTIPANTLTQIQTVINGWNAVTNSIGLPGAVVEGDPNGRVRRQQSVAIASQSMTDGIQAALLTLPGVSQAVIWENDKDYAVPLGSGTLLANSIYAICLIQADSASDPDHTSSSADPIANKIVELKGIGCNTQGSVTKYPVDNQGHAHLIQYSKAEEVDVKIIVTVRMRYNWPLDGGSQIAVAIVAWANGINPDTGKPNIAIGGDSSGNLSWTDVLASFINTVHGFDFLSMVFSVDGGSTYSTNGANVPLAYNQIARIISANISVHGN